MTFPSVDGLTAADVSAQITTESTTVTYGGNANGEWVKTWLNGELITVVQKGYIASGVTVIVLPTTMPDALYDPLIVSAKASYAFSTVYPGTLTTSQFQRSGYISSTGAYYMAHAAHWTATWIKV